MTPRRRSTPTADERAVVDVYQRAERALLVAAAKHAGDSAAERVGVPEGVDAVRRATRSVVAQLDRAAPGLLADALATAAIDGTDRAVRMLRDAPGRDLPPGETGVNLAALDNVAVAALDRSREVSSAILRGTPDNYRRALEGALPAGLVGAQTRRQVTQRAVWELADRGITSFVDRSGRTWRASSYMEMATRAALQRATEDAKLDRLRAAGHDLVIVQGGRDRCPRCLPWNGRVLSITGNNHGTLQLPDAIDGATLVTVEVAGTVAAARLAGWGHPACRCALDLWQPGITRAVPARERQPDGAYEARQRQRAIERQIRGAKEREAAAIDKPGAAEARKLVRAAQARMREHLDVNPDLLRRRYREQIGAGNTPDDDQAAAFATEDPLPAVRAELLSRLQAAEVERRRRAAEARGDDTAASQYRTEQGRRQQRNRRRRAA